MSLRARTWTGILLPMVLWFLFQQGLSALLHADCSRSGIGLAWGVASLAGCGVAGWVCLPLARHRGELANPWLARLALAIAAIFGLAIAFQTLAIAMVPSCVG